jgi:hypothetical protein
VKSPLRGQKGGYSGLCTWARGQGDTTIQSIMILFKRRPLLAPMHTSPICLTRMSLLLGLLTAAAPSDVPPTGVKPTPTPTALPGCASPRRLERYAALSFQLDGARGNAAHYRNQPSVGWCCTGRDRSGDADPAGTLAWLADARDRGKHELDDQPARQVPVAVRASAEVLGQAYHGSVLQQ